MQKLNDARSIRSQQALREALLDLMAEMLFDGISLRMIVSRAGVSAPTFYRHYTTKEGLLADVASDEIKSVMSLPMPVSGKYRGMTSGDRICAFIDGRRALWRTLLSAGALPIMREVFIRHAQEVAQRGPRLNPRFPSELMAGVVASGLFEIIAWWLRQPDDYPISEVAQMLQLLVINPAIRPPQTSAS